MPTRPGFATRYFTAQGFRVTSPFGPRPDPFDPSRTDFHTGIDYGGQPLGTPVQTPAAGTVFVARMYLGWGNLVAVEDHRKHLHLFAHLHQIHVNPGQSVLRGAVVGTVGKTGHATGPHVHYQINRPGTGVRRDGYFGNPDAYIYDDEVVLVDRAIVLGSEADFFNAAPLRDRLNCPVFLRPALGELSKVKTVYICGGPVEPVAEAAPQAELVVLSGNNRFETAAKIFKFLNS